MNRRNWFELQVKTVQHGVGERGPRSRVTGELVCGPETLSDEELAANRTDVYANISAHPLDDRWHRALSADWPRVQVPFLSAGAWGGQAMHLRGNVEGFVRAASADRWLELHGGEHWASFYTARGVELQRRFFDRFLRRDSASWPDHPRVRLRVQRTDGTFVDRGEDDWPIRRTRWTRLHLGVGLGELPDAPGALEFDAFGDGVELHAEPVAVETELTGPSSAKLFVSSTTADADLFLILRVYDPAGHEISFQGSNDPRSALGKGWLRASHRRLDEALSTEARPYHRHDRVEPLEPGEIYELEVEIWPLSVILPPGHSSGCGSRAVTSSGRIRPASRTSRSRCAARGLTSTTTRRPPAGALRRAHDDPHRARAPVVAAPAGGAVIDLQVVEVQVAYRYGRPGPRMLPTPEWESYRESDVYSAAGGEVSIAQASLGFDEMVEDDPVADISLLGSRIAGAVADGVRAGRKPLLVGGNCTSVPAMVGGLQQAHGPRTTDRARLDRRARRLQHAEDEQRRPARGHARRNGRRVLSAPVAARHRDRSADPGRPDPDGRCPADERVGADDRRGERDHGRRASTHRSSARRSSGSPKPPTCSTSTSTSTCSIRRSCRRTTRRSPAGRASSRSIAALEPMFDTGRVGAFALVSLYAVAPAGDKSVAAALAILRPALDALGSGRDEVLGVAQQRLRSGRGRARPGIRSRARTSAPYDRARPRSRPGRRRPRPAGSAPPSFRRGSRRGRSREGRRRAAQRSRRRRRRAADG